MSCSDCTSGDLLPGSPKSTEKDGAYLAKGSNQEDAKDKVIVLFTDIFGLISNPKIIADTIAERTGFDVCVPDIFNGTYSIISAVKALGAHSISFARDTRRLHLMCLIASPPVARVRRSGSGRAPGSTGSS